MPSEKLIKMYGEYWKELEAKGYTASWQTRNEWRCVWGLCGSQIQVKEVRIRVSNPDFGPHLISRWRTVFYA